MEGRLLDKIARSFSLEMPEFKKMDQYLDFIIPLIQPWSEDLREQEFYLDTRWLEIRDDPNFHDSILHIFRAKGEYLISVDGNISKGGWRTLLDTNTLILDSSGKSELYDLAFLNSNFFILQKHGNQERKGMRKYFVIGKESYISELEWQEIMDLLFNHYRDNSKFISFVIIAVVVAAIAIAFSVF